MSDPNIPLVPSSPEDQPLPDPQPRIALPLFVPCAPGSGRAPAANDLLNTSACQPTSESAIRSAE
jgi:hypothetical protein